MPLVSQEDQAFLRDKFRKEMVNDVSITLFVRHDTPPQPPSFDKETEQLLQEIASLSDKISLEVLDIAANADRARQAGIDRTPAIIVDGSGKNGVRYFGIPSGYEFRSLVEDIIDVSKGLTDLSSNTKQALQGLARNVHIQVFVTPT